MKTSDTRTGGLIDTSKMSAGERAALEMAEAARGRTRRKTGFAGGLFMGKAAFEEMVPFPGQTLEDRDQGDAFLEKLRGVLDRVDADAIDDEGEVPDDVIEELAEIGAFGIKVPTRFGGLGLSQTNYARAAMELGGVCGNLTALLSAHQSIGVPQPLIVFGTEEQKRKYLPRVAAGEISAFALTESGVGSDPAKMATTAEPSADGEAFVLNGEKLWCTNGTRAGVVVVMARTPSGPDGRPKVTAFIVETDWPGVEVIQRCRFMGLRALYNGVLRFEDVRVPKENILLAEGKGLKVALTTLNTGRITLPAACVGMAKRCVEAMRSWAGRRVQWGAAIGKHAAVADKVARAAADTFALEAVTLAVAGAVDRRKDADIRIEAAMAKLWGTEAGWRIVDDTMQVRGGRGYETAASLAARGEEAVPVERWMRDCRINTIFEGSSEIMRLFIVREVLDPHLRVGAAAVNTTLPWGTRLKAMLRAAVFYAGWYPRQWVPAAPGKAELGMHPRLRPHAAAVRRESRKLARRLFHAMVRFGPKLDKQQVLLGRFVDIGTELFVMGAVLGYAERKVRSGLVERERERVLGLAEYFCRKGEVKVGEISGALRKNVDREGYRVAQRVLG